MNVKVIFSAYHIEQLYVSNLYLEDFCRKNKMAFTAAGVKPKERKDIIKGIHGCDGLKLIHSSYIVSGEKKLIEQLNFHSPSDGGLMVMLDE